MEKRTHIQLTDAEIQSGLDRQRFAENLIILLHPEHDGRNTWLMNYGSGQEAERVRKAYKGDHKLTWNENTHSLDPVGDYIAEGGISSDAMTLENIIREGWEQKVEKELEVNKNWGFEKGNLFLIFNHETQLAYFIFKDPSKVDLPGIANAERFTAFFECDSIFKLRMFTYLINQ